MKFTAIYALAVGVLMVAQWTFFILSGQVPELQSEPLRTAFHLMAELATAVALLAAGIGILRKSSWARSLAMLALGMLSYTLIQSPGYFAQQQVWALVGMFAVLLALALIGLRQLLL